jgi:peroxiredoxin
MTLKKGDQLPDATFTVMGEDGPEPRSTKDVFAGKKVILIGVPGAFTPTCHRNHLPGYLDNFEAFKDKGVDTIAVTSVNDVFVQDAWAKASHNNGRVLFLADGNGDFAKKTGLELDMTQFGMGVRCQRYAMLVNDGKVELLFVEDSPGEAQSSGASTMLKALAS